MSHPRVVLSLLVVLGGLSAASAQETQSRWTEQDIADAIAFGLLPAERATAADLNRPVTLGDVVRLLLEARPYLRGLPGEPGPPGPPGPAGPPGAATPRYRAPTASYLPPTRPTAPTEAPLPLVSRRNQIADWVLGSASRQTQRQYESMWEMVRPRGDDGGGYSSGSSSSSSDECDSGHCHHHCDGSD
ncbi:MAG: hypothetical protein FJX74_20790 [Armatimonadetes bacterium]|nr:hypothetical protein [Armatimonadota bacterium]